MRIATKIIIAILLSATAFVLVAGGLIYRDTFSVLREDILARNTLATQTALNSVDRFLFARLREIQSMAEAPPFEQPDISLEVVSDRLREFTVLSGPWDELMLVDLDGTIIASSEADLDGVSIERFPYEAATFHRMVMEQTAVHSDAILSTETDRPTVVFGAPVHTENPGRSIVRFVIANVSWPAVEEFLEDVSGDDVHLINKEGQVIGNGVLSHAHPYFSQVDLAEGDSFVIQVKEQGFSDYYGNGWQLYTENDREIAFAPAFEVASRLVLVMIVLAVITATTIVLIFGRMIVRPVRRLKEGVDALAGGAFESDLKVQSGDELGELAGAFNAMAGNIQALNRSLASKVKRQSGELAESYTNLEFEKRKLEIALLSIGDAAFMIDTEERLTFFNPIAEELTGYAAKEVLNQPYKEYLKFVFEKDHKVNDGFIKRALRDGKLSHITNHTVLVTKDGKDVPIADSAAPIRDADGKIVGCIVVFRDVTKERDIDRMKTEFISLSAHQLRTPLTAIRWSLEALGGAKALTPAQKGSLDITMQASERMSQIITALLNIARIESQRLKIEPETVDPKALCEEILKTMRPLIEKKGHAVTLTVASGSGTMETDPLFLHEILTNLLSNAVKYTPDKGKITLKVKPQGHALLFSVTDNGYGIPAAQQERLYQKFFRADNIIKRDTEGNGLGMYMVEQLVTALGGEISFTSKEDAGTTFRVLIPKKGLKPQKGQVTLAS